MRGWALGLLGLTSCVGATFSTGNPLVGGDSGASQTEAGDETAEAGVPGMESGAPEDSGPLPEAGLAEADPPPADAGTPVLDSGAPPAADSGPPTCTYAASRFTVAPASMSDAGKAYPPIATDATTGLHWALNIFTGYPMRTFCTGDGPPPRDWRVPTADELSTIMLPGCTPPYDASVFPNMQGGIYMTADPTVCFNTFTLTSVPCSVSATDLLVCVSSF